MSDRTLGEFIRGPTETEKRELASHLESVVREICGRLPEFLGAMKASPYGALFFEEARQSPTLEQDVISFFFARTGIHTDEYLQELYTRLPGHFPRPVHWARLQALKDAFQAALKERAVAHGSTPQAELRDSVLANLMFAWPEIRDCLFCDPAIFHRVRGTLNRETSKDLLGEDYRRKASPARCHGLDEGPEPVTSDDSTLEALHLEHIMHARLREEDRALVAKLFHGFTIAEIASQEHTPAATLRQRHSRLKKKLGKI